MNFETFFIWNPDVFTFRLLGFGLFACNKNALPLISREKPWMIPGFAELALLRGSAVAVILPTLECEHHG